MRGLLISIVAVMLGLFFFDVSAAVYSYETYGKEIKITETRNLPSNFGQFGEVIDLNSGSLSFTKTLIELRGNNSIRVAADFTYALSDRLGYGPHYEFRRALPYIQGIHSAQHGWVVGSDSVGFTTQRCSNPRTEGVAFAVRSLKPPRHSYSANDYWDGNQLVGVEGGGIIYRRNINQSSIDGLDTPWATNGNWRFSCYMLSDGSEGFIGHSPDGMKYYFGIPVAGQDILEIQSNEQYETQTFLEVALFKMYLVKVEDRFGNWVKYEPNEIIASDGRSITFSSNANTTMVTANNQTWTVSYSANMVAITNPDQTTWTVSQSGQIDPFPRNPATGCSGQQAIHSDYTGQTIIAMKLESGLNGKFTLQPRRHGYSYVWFDCRALSHYGPFYTETQNFVDEVSLVSRVLEGPGVPILQHNIDYGPVNACYVGTDSPDACTSNSPATRTVTVKSSGGDVEQYIFGNRIHEDSGLLLSKNTVNLNVNYYQYVKTHANFSGWGKRKMYNVSDYSVNVLTKRTTTQSGRNFIWQMASDCGIGGDELCADQYFRPTKIIKSSSSVP